MTAADRDEICKRLFALADGDGDGFIWRRDLETLCRELDLGYTADAILPNDHRGRVTYLEFQSYFKRLPETLLYNESSASSCSSIERKALRADAWNNRFEDTGNGEAPALNKGPITLVSLKTEIMDLTNRLNEVTAERDHLQQAVKIIESSKNKKDDNRWEAQCQRYEERIIELHSVIAELSKKMEEEKDDMIKEESEYESNVDNQSIVTDSFIDDKLRYRDEYEDYTSLAFERDLEIHTRSLKKGQMSNNKDSAAGTSDTDKSDESKFNLGFTKQLEMQVLELYSIRDQFTQEKMEKEDLALKLEQREKELKASQQQINVLSAERDNFKRQVSDLKNTVEYQEAKMESKAAPKEPFLTRFAERRSLRKKRHDKGREKDVQSPLESDAKGLMSSFAKLNIKAARSSTSPEHIASPIQTEQAVIFPTRPTAEKDFANKCKEFEIEIEKISSHVEHLKSQNHVLSLTLEESKTTCDSLTELLGRYESNNTALQIALSYCDHMVESYDVLVALLETENALTNATVRPPIEDKITYQRADSNRKSAESVAKHLLSRLEKHSRPDSGLATSHFDTTWDDSSGYSHTTSSTSTTSSGLDPDFSKQDESKLREHISKLKVGRSQVQSTVMELESIHADKDPPPVSTLSSQESRNGNSNADLEMAVLIQELMCMREERADLRAKIYLLEKEKTGMEMNSEQQMEKERVLRTKVDHLQETLLYQEATIKGSKTFVLDDREVYLKERVENLLSTLEKMTRNSELRQKQSADLIDDLKKANEALTDALDKSKKKYQCKIKKLEQQMLGLMYHQNKTDTISTHTSSQNAEIP